MTPFPSFSSFSLFLPGRAPRADSVVRPLSDAARAVLQADAQDWAGRRAPPSPSDLAVGRAGRTWLASLPVATWPGELARQFPRIVNQLALAWPDRVLCDRTFDRLLVDDRGGRQGFPPAVQAELLALRRLRADQSRSVSDVRLGLVALADSGPWAGSSPFERIPDRAQQPRALGFARR